MCNISAKYILLDFPDCRYLWDFCLSLPENASKVHEVCQEMQRNAHFEHKFWEWHCWPDKLDPLLCNDQYIHT